MDTIIIVISILLFMIIVASFLLLFGFKKKNEKMLILSKYVLPVALLAILFLLNFVSHDSNGAYLYIMFAIAFLVNAKNIYSDYMNLMKNPLSKIGFHSCVSSLLSIILIFSIVYSAIETYIPCSFSNVSTVDPIAKTIDFLYFSVTTFTTVGFGDITPQTTLARASVTLEILTAFAMLVLAVNFLIVKKKQNSNQKPGEITDEKPGE